MDTPTGSGTRAGVATGEKQQSDDMRENKSFERVYLI